MRYFVAVARELNFTRAAAHLHISKPSLSVQIRNLELEIGVDLFSREGRGVKLSEAGRVFLDHARKTLSDANRAVTSARQAANGEIGALSIGYSTPAAFQVFRKIIPAFKGQFPEIRLEFHYLRMHQLLEQLRQDELDVALVWMPLPTDEFDRYELVAEPLIAVLPSEHRLAQAREVSIMDLSSEPLILHSRALDPETYLQIEHLFLRAKATMCVAYQLENAHLMINFVAMGLGCSLLPAYSRSMGLEGITYKALKSPNIVKQLAIVKKKGRGDLAQSFYRFSIDALAKATQLPDMRIDRKRPHARRYKI